MAVKFQVAIKIPNFSIPRSSKIYPNVWFENKPSGNPGYKGKRFANPTALMR
jgi:hypothetical protein